MVRLVLMVSTLVCGTKGLSSNLRSYPLKLMSSGEIGKRAWLLTMY